MPYVFEGRGQPINVFQFGERGSGFRPRGSRIQDFHKLRESCIQQGILFEDPDFPAIDSTLFFSRSTPQHFEWKRPSELCDEPRLFVEGATRFDVVQGSLGDCWLLAAVANLTLNQSLFYRVVPDDQSFVQDYAGIFHFRFWQYGRWIDVVIDDRLPTFNGQLVYMHSKNHNEFWSALLEKAYAKLHGSYESLKGGTTCEAMEDFTGGVTELYELSKAPPNLYQIMLKGFERLSLMGCSIEPDPNITEMELENGLIRGHAYSITCVRLVDINTPRISGKIPLLRVRNPWGNECEWKGAWSDKSREWSLISDEEKQELGLVFEDDGEFWISYKDFVQQFSRVELCNLNPDSLEDEVLSSGSKKKWEMSMFEGSWVRGCTAGGCRNFPETFGMNPQYRITLEDIDDDDDEDLCTMIVGLMQKNRRSQRKMGQECLTIGFAIYHLKDPETAPKPLPNEYFKYNASVARSPSFINLREVSCRFKLPPGSYCVVPSTFDPEEEGDFVLRVFTEKQNLMSENDEDTGIANADEEVQIQDTDEEKSKADQIREFFATIAGPDLEVDCFELNQILNHALKQVPEENNKGVFFFCQCLPCGSTETDDEFSANGFSLDVCRSMVAMMDVDRSGKLGLEEFKNLWINIRTWKNVFKKYDMDGSGFLNTIELRAALHSAGYRVNIHVLQALVHRYGRDRKISFEDFIMCAVKLKTMIETFKEKDPRNLGRATFTMDEWVEKTMYS